MSDGFTFNLLSVSDSAEGCTAEGCVIPGGSMSAPEITEPAAHAESLEAPSRD